MVPFLAAELPDEPPPQLKATEIRAIPKITINNFFAIAPPSFHHA
jgi:hypothetical protein